MCVCLAKILFVTRVSAHSTFDLMKRLPGVVIGPTASRDPNDMREDERIAEMGKPRLGEHIMCRVTIKESVEFKVGTILLTVQC